MTTLKRETKWNIVDKLLSRWRSGYVRRYINENSVVCDVGCGQGAELLRELSPYIQKGYGFDFNLKKKNVTEKNIILLNDDFLQSDRDQKYDVICLMAVLEHVEYPDGVRQLLMGIRDRLKDDGIFLMTTPDKRAKGLLELLAYRLHIINEEEIRDHKHYFNKEELVDILEKVGFSNIKHEYFQLGLNNRIVSHK